MAVAAYASVINLLHVLDQIQHPVRRRLLPNTKQIETLHEKVHFLQEFLELHSPTKIQGIEDLMMKQITAVANEAEDIINSHVVDQLRQEYEDKTDDMGLSLLFSEDTNEDHVVNMEFSSFSFCQDIDKVIEKIDSIKEQLLTMVQAEGKAVQQQQPPIVSVQAGSSTLLPSRGKSSTHVVGFDYHLVEIKKLLTRDQPNLQIIPIVGMGGIGKTTLARFVFEDKYVVEKFDIRVWFTISQKYSVHEILLGVQCDIGVLDDLKNKTLAELRLQLYQELSGRRYLIVMDDLWSTNGWDDFKSSFPNYRNGSRVMMTTRLTDVAVSLGSHNPYFMKFLDEDNSWNLLCNKAFTQGSCSAELEEIGKRIARSCRGLPLAIVVIGGLLSKSNMKQEYWEFVAGKVNLLVSTENDEDCSKILLLSYNHLPIHLKPCFLYMGFFSEDHEIEVSYLTESWVVEGFLKPIRGESLEEVANKYLKDLIERNLILIQERDFGDIKRCGVHDLLRDLCRRESLKEHFSSVPKSQAINFHFRFNYNFNHNPTCFLSRDKGHRDHLPSPVNGLVDDPKCYHHLLVKFDEYDKELPIYTKLRRLFVYNLKKLPFVFSSTISQLWNLHTLYIESTFTQVIINLPFEIWEMPQLRHVIVKGGFYLPIVDEIGRKNFIILENLHTLARIYEFRCTEDVVKRIPNMKELEITYENCERVRDWSRYCLHNIANLHKLESLLIDKCSLRGSTFAFPYSLKKLMLWECRIPWEDMTVIGSLPNLEILLLIDREFNCSWLAHEWINPVEGGFRQLNFLLINAINLKRWTAESVHFPKLEILELVCIWYLEEIPRGIGEIETLRKIEVISCSDSVEESAKEIYEEQQSFGNEDFQIIIKN